MEEFHPFSAKGYTVRKEDLQTSNKIQNISENIEQSLEGFSMSDDQIDAFLDADDPAMMYELENQFNS